MKRLLCFLTLLACLSWIALAVPKTDGLIGPREYNETLATLQIPQHESNNHLSFAYLHWFTSPSDHSVYLGVQYHCDDHAVEDGLTGVRVYINDEPVGTVFANGTVEGVDHDRFELVGILDDGAWGPPYDSFCEVRVGIKFWPDGDIFAGVQILDFSGNPSNYYRQNVYSPYIATTKPDTFAASGKTTTEKGTTAKTTTTQTTNATESTARTTVPVITAAPKREPTATAAAVSVPQPTVILPETVVTTKTTTAKTTKTTTAKLEKTTDRPADETKMTAPVAAAVLPTKTTASASTSTSAASDAQMYKELNKAKIVGIVLVVAILTAAVMSSVFLGMRQKKEPAETRTPQEEYEDFG